MSNFKCLGTQDEPLVDVPGTSQEILSQFTTANSPDREIDFDALFYESDVDFEIYPVDEHPAPIDPDEQPIQFVFEEPIRIGNEEPIQIDDDAPIQIDDEEPIQIDDEGPIEAHNHVEYNPPDPIQRNDQPELIPIADIIEVDPIRPRVLKQASITNFFKR